MGKFDGVLLVSDYDDTLYDHKHRIPERNLRALEYFMAEGGRFTLASGRYGKALDRLFPGYKEYVNAPAILCNGALLCDVHTGEMIREVKRQAAEILPMLRDLAIRFPELEINPIVKDAEIGVSIGLCDLKPCHECFKIVTGGQPELLDRVREYFVSQYGERWAQSKSCKHLLEFLIPEGTKGRALSHLRQYLEKLDGECKIIAVGDYENDLDMLMAADIAACPENAVDEVKAISKIHLCDHHDGCIADLVNKILN